MPRPAQDTVPSQFLLFGHGLLRSMTLGSLFLGALALSSCRAPHDSDRSATSFLGTPLPSPTLPAAFVEAQTQFLADAEAQASADPADVDAQIWIGRRLAYLARYHEAIETYSRAIGRFPNDPRLYRHRGHRWLTLRQLDRAIEDFERAQTLMLSSPDRLEPDGLPNAKNKPTSTLYTNVYYHLGLARYLKGEYREARRAYEAGFKASKNPDMRSAMGYWLVLTLWRLDDQTSVDALLRTIDPQWDLIENEHYHGLLRAYAGDAAPETLWTTARQQGGVALATVGYGYGAWLDVQGRPRQAHQVWQEVVDAGTWSAFGAIAAEAELASNFAEEATADNP